MENLHPRVIWIFFFNTIFGGFFFFLFISMFALPFFIGLMKDRMETIVSSVEYYFLNFSLGSNLWIFFLFLLYLVLCYLWAKLSYRYWGYELTQKAIKVEKGVIWKKYISIPYDRIQNVDIYRGVLARILGLSDIHIQTAGYSGYGKRGFGTEGRLPGLDVKKSEQLREELIEKVSTTRQGL